MLPVRRIQDLDETPSGPLWMIEGLWTAGAVGIVGGEPKSYKSFLALDLAVAVTSGAPCLRKFEVALTGRVLIYAAEDSPGEVRRRLQGISLAAGVAFESLDIYIITVPVLRLDRPDDREELHQTVASLRPRLLILDPLVRLHGGDENAVADMAPLLAYLRQLQRELGVAVLLVHHARKGSAHMRAGQALRGSSELHAWGDSNLYVRRKGPHLRLTPEHRTAPSGEDVCLELAVKGAAVALAVRTTPAEKTPDEVTALHRVEQALATATAPLTQRQLRSLCKMQAAKLCEALQGLVKTGRAIKTAAGYTATRGDPGQRLLFPDLSGELKRNGNGKRMPA